MKQFAFIALMCCYTCLRAQTLLPVAIEDKQMDARMTVRKPAKLTVQIKNLPANVKTVSIKYTLVQFGVGWQSARYSNTDAAGSSTIILDQNLPYQQIWLNVNDYLYAGIYVNSGLTVTIDADKVTDKGVFMIGEGINYLGPDGELNTVMNKSILFKKDEKENLSHSLSVLSNSRAKYTPDAFLFKADSIRRLLTKIDNEFIAGYPNYAWAVNSETLSEYYGTLCIGYWGSVMPVKLFNEMSKQQPYFISNSGALFYKYLCTYNLSNKPYKTDRLDSTLTVFDRIYSQQKADILKLNFLDDEKDNFAKSYPVIINSIKTKWIKKIATNELTKASIDQKRIDSLFALSKKLDGTEFGKPLTQLPFDAKLYQLDTIKDIDDLIARLKTEFPKKALIVDFWATWCAPCLADLPFSKKLHENNKDLPIEYIYLCTNSGSSMDVWKNKVAGLQIPGTHIYVDDKIIARLKTAFNAEGGFPTYVVIDINGKVKTKMITRMEYLNREGVKTIVGL